MLTALTLLLPLFQFSSAEVSCKDMSGNSVPWFLLIKPPTATSNNYGQEFMYLDKTHLIPVLSPSLINQPGAVSYTLSQIDNKSISSILFK